VSERDAQYRASESVIGAVFALLMGLALFALFGGLLFDSILELFAYPDAPTPVRVREAAEMREVPRGSWVKLVDVRLDCAHPPRRGNSGSDYYGLVSDESGAPRLLVAFDEKPSCEAPIEVIGALRSGTPGRIVGLDWPDIDWNAWPSPMLNVVWTSLGPSDDRIALWLMPLLLCPALLLVWIGADGIRRRARPTHRAPLPSCRYAMPLSTGASVLSAFSPVIGGLQLLAFGPIFVAKHLPEWTTLPIGILWAVWFFAVLGSIADGWKRRASDLLFGKDVVAIRGGPLHGLQQAWNRVDPSTFRFVRYQPKGEVLEDRAGLLLKGELVALTQDENEARSLEVIAETIDALSRQAKGERLPRTIDAPPEVIHCPSCGAAVPPSARERTRCAHCRGDVPMPEAAREQLAALESLESSRRRSEQHLRKLLDQPGARATNAIFIVALPPVVLGWPIAGIFFDELHQIRHILGWREGLALFVATLTFSYGLTWLVRAQVYARSAIRWIASRFAAVPAVRSGGDPSCRSCSAPLPTSDDPERLVAICVYCRCENVLSTDLVPIARIEASQAGDLAVELAQVIVRRRRLRLVSIASLFLLALSLVALAPALAKVIH
jgi:hypothetical protein